MSPALSTEGQKALRVLLRQSALSGRELASRAELTSEELYKATLELLDVGVISVNEPSFDVNQISRVYFNVNPSARSFAEFAVR